MESYALRNRIDSPCHVDISDEDKPVKEIPDQDMSVKEMPDQEMYVKELPDADKSVKEIPDPNQDMSGKEMLEQDKPAKLMPDQDKPVEANIKQIMDDKKLLEFYMKEIFSKSLITGVSNIVETKHPARKLFKLSILIICIIGFFYQTKIFMQHFLEYPTTMDMGISQGEKFFLPAITICERFRISKRQFCHKYPWRCEPPANQEEYCKNYRKLCEEIEEHLGSVQIPQKEYMNYNLNDLRGDYSDIVMNDPPIIFRSFFSKENYFLVDAEGNKEVFKLSSKGRDNTTFLCFGWNLRIDSTMNPLALNFSDISATGKLLRITHTVMPEEYFLAPEMAEALFFVHSPFTVPDFRETDNWIRANNYYSAYIQLVETYSLPAPYSSNCNDYMKSWDEDMTEARSREMCLEKCSLDTLLSTCNCQTHAKFYDSNAEKCWKLQKCNDMTSPEFRDKEKICRPKCRTECQKTEYTYTFTRIALSSAHKVIETDSSIVDVSVAENVIQYRQQPKYEFIELFGIMGGFAGLWLGIAVVNLVDFLESLVMITIFRCRQPRI